MTSDRRSSEFTGRVLGKMGKENQVECRPVGEGVDIVIYVKECLERDFRH